MEAFFKFIWRGVKTMLGSVSCVALIGVTGYFVSFGLNWLTRVVMNILTSAANYLMNNWVAVIFVVIAITLGGIAFEGVVNWFKNRKNTK